MRSVSATEVSLGIYGGRTPEDSQSRPITVQKDYVCIVKTMNFESAGGGRELRAGKNRLTRTPVKKLRNPILYRT